MGDLPNAEQFVKAVADGRWHTLLGEPGVKNTPSDIAGSVREQRVRIVKSAPSDPWSKFDTEVDSMLAEGRATSKADAIEQLTSTAAGQAMVEAARTATSTARSQDRADRARLRGVVGDAIAKVAADRFPNMTKAAALDAYLQTDGGRRDFNVYNGL